VIPKTFIATITICLCSFFAFSQNTVTDNSGNIYKTVKIGNQIWMAENLRTEKFNNGEPIEQITSDRYWQEISLFAMNDSSFMEIVPVMCYYNNVKQNNNALYNWYVVIDSRNVCPIGWHIPSSVEFNDLINFVGDNEAGFAKIKSSTLWENPGSNSTGFNVLPIGIRYGSGEFGDEKTESTFWSDTYTYSLSELTGISFKINTNFNNSELRGITKNVGASIRCLKN
jgi:uncharacterized protein (TIGR02145 family)